MVKKLPLLLALIAATFNFSVRAQCPGATVDTLFFSDFESNDGGLVPDPAGDWQYGNIPDIIAGANCGSTFNSPGGAHSGTQGWATILNDCYNNLGAFSTLELTVDLSNPAYLSAQLDFAQWFEVFVNFDYLTITANGTEVFSNDTLELSSSWLTTSVDLSPFLGQSAVVLDFNLWASTVVNRAGWYLDDVSVTACTSGPDAISETGMAAFRAWPVPAHDVLHVEPSMAMGKVLAWTLFDASGRVVAEGVPTGSGRFGIDVSAFQGLGILELRTANGAQRQQIVMQ